MGTHPIFESDFDCLTDVDLNKVVVVGFIRNGREAVEMNMPTRPI